MKTIKITLLTFIILALAITSVMAASLNRDVPASVESGKTFTVTYSTSGAPSGKWFVAWEDTITGGCTPIKYNNFLASETGGQSSQTKTFTAPVNGSCTFSGFYQFTNESQKTLSSKTITITSGTQSPISLWLILGIIAGILVIYFVRKK